MTRLDVRFVSMFMAWKGLLGESPESICFKTRFGIHTVGMKYPIDIIILDSKECIQKMKQNLQPNRLFFWNPLFDRVVELPAGSIRSKHLVLKQKIHLQYL